MPETFKIQEAFPEPIVLNNVNNTVGLNKICSLKAFKHNCKKRPDFADLQRLIQVWVLYFFTFSFMLLIISNRGDI
jgi:hypothetical protein